MSTMRLGGCECRVMDGTLIMDGSAVKHEFALAFLDSCSEPTAKRFRGQLTEAVRPWVNGDLEKQWKQRNLGSW